MDPQIMEQMLSQLSLAMVLEQPKGEELLAYGAKIQPWDQVVQDDYWLAG
jgi:hypothetical protein